MNWYRIKTALVGLKRLAELSEEDKQACIDAYKFFQRMQDGEPTETEAETKAVADYYKVLNNLLSVFDLEKLYIPPQLDESQGLYGNQILVEQAVLEELDLKTPSAPISWTWAAGGEESPTTLRHSRAARCRATTSTPIRLRARSTGRRNAA